MYPSNRNHHRRQPSAVHTLLDDDRGSAAATTTPPLPLPSLALPPAQFQMAPVLIPSPFPDGRAAALAFPATPPTTHDSDLDPRAAKILSTATHVLSTEATALSCLSRLYATDPLCRDGFVRAVEAIVASQGKAGKIVVIGVGKSGKIGDKLVASMNSLGLMSVFLNPVEALHGDLGIVRKVCFTAFFFFFLSFFFFSVFSVQSLRGGGGFFILSFSFSLGFFYFSL